MTETDQEKMDEGLRRMLNTPPTPHKVKKDREAAGVSPPAVVSRQK